MNSIDLNGRRAIVTGGAQGLGRAIGERLQASGAAVYVWDFDPAAMAEAEADWPDGGPAGWIEVDVSDADAVEAALRETQAAPAASTSWSTTPASPAPTCRPGSTRWTTGAG